MAIYHLSLKAIQRSKGRSATASAAYRSRAKITDERTGQIYDYSRRKGIEYSSIFTPDRSQITREKLWNLAEEAERRKDGITAREWEIALPCELDKNQRIELTRNFCVMLIERYGIAVDVAIHAPTSEGDQRNFHAHVQTTTRRLTNGILGAKSDFELSGTERRKKGLKSQKEELEDIRLEWERMVNASLEQAGRLERVSCKSLPDQGERRPPTVHLGVAATAMERRGVQTERGDLNRWPVLRKLYAELTQVKKEMRDMETRIAEMRQNEERKYGYLREARGNSQDERPAERGREPECIHSPASKASPAKETARPGFPASTANVGSKRPVQSDKITTGRAEESTKYAGGAGEGYSRIAGQTGENTGSTRKNSRDAQRVSGQRQAGSISSRPGYNGEAGKSGRTDQLDLVSGREDRKAHWLKRLSRVEDGLIRLLREYRTIGDLLVMNKVKEEEKKTQSEEDEEKSSPKGPE